MKDFYATPKPGQVAPETEEGHLYDTITTHPAFAQIGASRVSGSTNLYDSDFTHNGYMVIRITRSELHRGLNNDRHHGREEYIEVALSESQWATFVSAPNIGSGVPCTLQHRNGQRIPGIPDFNRKALVKDEMDQDFSEVLSGLDEALAAVDAAGLSAKKADVIKGKIRRAKQMLDKNIPFAMEQFEEHVEKTVERGKAEIHGYMTNVIHRSGIEALKGAAPLQIEEEK